MNILDQFEIKDGSFSSHQAGTHVYFKQYIPKKLEAKAFHFILQHGAVTYHGTHGDLIEYLLKRFKNQIVISCMDLVGHGLSGGPRAFVESFEVYEQDFITFNQIAFETIKELNLPVVVCGQSLGGMIVTKCLVEYKDKLPFKVSKVILCNPCIKPKISIPKPLLGKLNKLGNMIGKLRLPSIYRGVDLVSDPEKAIRFDHDHLNSNFMTVNMGQEILKTSNNIINLSYFIDFPVMFLTSGIDVIVDLNATLLFMTGIKREYVTHVHFEEAKHDILNDKNRKEVFRKIEEYVKDLI